MYFGMALLFRLPEKVGSKVAGYLDVPSFLSLLELEDSVSSNETSAFRWRVLFEKRVASTRHFWAMACQQLLPRSLFEKELERYHCYAERPTHNDSAKNGTSRVRLCTMRARFPKNLANGSRDSTKQESEEMDQNSEDSCKQIFDNCHELNRWFVHADDQRYEISTRSRNLMNECSCERVSMLRKRYTRVRFISSSLIAVLRDVREILLIDVSNEAHVNLRLVLPDNMQKRCFITDFAYWQVRIANYTYFFFLATTTFGLWHSFYIRQSEASQTAPSRPRSYEYQLVGSHFDMLYKAPYASIHRGLQNNDRLIVHSSHVLDTCFVELELNHAANELSTLSTSANSHTNVVPGADANSPTTPSTTQPPPKGFVTSARVEVQHRFVTQQDARVAAVDACGDVVVWFDLLRDLPAYGNFALLLGTDHRQLEQPCEDNTDDNVSWYRTAVHANTPSWIPASSKLQNDHVSTMLASATNSRRRNCAQQAQAVLASPHDDAPEHWLQRRVPPIASTTGCNQLVIALVYIDPLIIYLCASGEAGIAELPTCRVLVSYDFWSSKRRIPEILTQYSNLLAITMQYGEVWFYALPLTTFRSTTTGSAVPRGSAPPQHCNGDSGSPLKATPNVSASAPFSNSMDCNCSGSSRVDGRPRFELDGFSFDSPLFVLPPDACPHLRNTGRIITPESSTVLCADLCWNSAKRCVNVVLGSEVNLRLFDCFRQNRLKRKAAQEAAEETTKRN